jgi:hypothetical protein
VGNGEIMSRKQRRQPEQDAPNPAHEKKLLDKSPPDDEQSARAKSHRHKKVTADKWNQ